MATTYNKVNLQKHGITVNEVDEVLARKPMDFDLIPGTDNHPHAMFVGFTYTGRLLEIGIEYISDQDENIFHAMDATRFYRDAFGKRSR